MSRGTTLAPLLALLVAFAGCGGSGSTPPTDQPPAHSARLEGTVFDDSQAPIQGASIRVLLTELVTMTDAHGRYEFASAPTQALRLVASADGHGSQTRGVNLTAGSIGVVDFVLPTIPRIIPFHETKRFNGEIVCGLPQGAGCPSEVQTQNSPRFDVQSGLRSVIVELQWTPPGPNVNQRLAMDVLAATSTACGIPFAVREGPSVLRLNLAEGFPVTGGHLCIEVRSPPDGATASQAYALFVSLFYHQPAADGFTAVSS